MPDATSPSEAVLEVVAPDGTRRIFPVTHTPFLIGRGAETNNDLQLPDLRISRQCAAIVEASGALFLEDRGHRRGLFVNGQRIERKQLEEGDAINFGLDDSFELLFHATSDALPDLLSRMESLSVTGGGAGTSGLRKLSLLLEATALLHSHLPLDAIIGNMVDHAIALTGADRGLLVERGADNVMRVRLARQRGGKVLETAGLEPTQTAIRHAIEQKRAIITEDLEQNADLKSAKSVIMQRLRSLVVIPLYAFAQKREGTLPDDEVRGELLGVLYLDSTRPAGFSTLERQILDALAVEAASVMDNARMVERERERERMEQELGIAREIQQALLPRDFRTGAHLQLSGMNQSCLTVGGDYFDVMELGPGRTAFLIADVSGKGLGAALLTTMLQGAFSGMAIQQPPAGVFGHINNFLCGHSRLERYATVFFAILSEDGQLDYINAGHPSPVLLRNGRAEAPFAAESFPVGLIPDAVYKLESRKLEPGDTLVLFSDGVTEAMDPEDNEFGTDRLKLALESQHRDAIEDVQTDVLAAIGKFARGASPRDDITIVVARYLGARQAADA
ncbi:MAG: SpoIIE family protein phosphatase [Candidatus Acidiferrales bacterium]